MFVGCKKPLCFHALLKEGRWGGVWRVYKMPNAQCKNKFPQADLHNTVHTEPKGSVTEIILSDWLQAFHLKLKIQLSRHGEVKGNKFCCFFPFHYFIPPSKQLCFEGGMNFACKKKIKLGPIITLKSVWHLVFLIAVVCQLHVTEAIRTKSILGLILIFFLVDYVKQKKRKKKSLLPQSAIVHHQ